MKGISNSSVQGTYSEEDNNEIKTKINECNKGLFKQEGIVVYFH
jgi:hypothetical protein